MVRETRSLLRGKDSTARDTIIPLFISNRSKSFRNREMFHPIAIEGVLLTFILTGTALNCQYKFKLQRNHSVSSG